jgi:hypothetical protein
MTTGTTDRGDPIVAAVDAAPAARPVGAERLRPRPAAQLDPLRRDRHRREPGVGAPRAPDDALRYFSRFNELLARTDVLWTKPSKLSLFAALGLPIVCAAPVGVHERRNRRWVRESGAGVKQRDPRFAAEWLGELLDEGELAAAAWSGYIRLPKLGLYRILAELAPNGALAGLHGSRRTNEHSW